MYKVALIADPCPNSDKNVCSLSMLETPHEWLMQTIDWIAMQFSTFGAHFVSSISLQIFTFSAGVLIGGVLMKVWTEGRNLSFLNYESLSEIEFMHPHLPSLEVIIDIFLCSITLLIVALQTVTNIPPFNRPYEWIYLAAIFIISGSVGILMELRKEGAKDYAFAFMIGTAIAYLFLVFKYTIPTGSLSHMSTLLMLLSFCIVLAWRMLFRNWTQQARVVALLTFVSWITIYLVG